MLGLENRSKNRTAEEQYARPYMLWQSDPESGYKRVIIPRDTHYPFDFGIASYFKTMKPPEEVKEILLQRGFSPEKDFPVRIPGKVMEELYVDCYANDDGTMTFFPGVVYLGHTVASVDLHDCNLNFAPYLVDSRTREPVPLTSNLHARIIYAGHNGVMTLEIHNRTLNELTVNLSHISLVGTLEPLSSPAQRKQTALHSTQNRGTIRVGGLY